MLEILNHETYQFGKMALIGALTWLIALSCSACGADFRVGTPHYWQFEQLKVPAERTWRSEQVGVAKEWQAHGEDKGS